MSRTIPELVALYHYCQIRLDYYRTLACQQEGRQRNASQEDALYYENHSRRIAGQLNQLLDEDAD
ncbi:hypothetical protein [Larkinella soli]|uniref:hypothetical protein n=1 Tax=Larkinella soli TaxID=1770527 RepID=UPI000FFB47F3|nr:hypothetical protein [Larkinella soli]